MANANHVAPQKMYGLIESSTISIEEITSLVQECFSIQLFKGLKKNEAFFIANPTDYETPITSLFELYGDKLSVKLLEEKEQLFRIEILSNVNKRLFLEEVKKVCGAEPVNKNYLKCIDYQLKLIDKFNLNPSGTILIETTETDQTALNERISNINLMLTKKSNDSPPNYEQHLKVDNLELVLFQKDLLKINADCIMTTFSKATSVLTSLTNYILTQSGAKYQQAFKRSLDQNFSSFLLPSNQMVVDSKYVLHLDTSKLDSLTQVEEVYKELFELYKKVLDTSNSLEFKSLAFTFLNTNYSKINLIALADAVKAFSKQPTQSLSKLIIVSLDWNSLKSLQDYLTKGYELPTFDRSNTPNGEKCSKCSSRKFLLKADCDFHSACDLCDIINQLIQFNTKSNDSNENQNEIICLKCAIKKVLDDLKLNHCSSCLNEFNNRYFSNQSCLKHTVCAECSRSSNLLAVCHNCTFHKFYSQFSRLNRASSDLMKNHEKFRCCFDFCESQLNLVELECKHTSRCESNVILCLFCSVFNVLDTLANKYEIRIDRLNKENNHFSSNNEIEIPENEATSYTQPIANNGLKCYSKIENLEESLPGYENYTTIEITFLIPDGIQNNTHPKPGDKYYGCMKAVYLPKNQEGLRLCDSLIKLFESNQLFSLIESSVTKGAYIASCNEISLKTSRTGGPENNGYPDPNYLELLREQLKDKFFN